MPPIPTVSAEVRRCSLNYWLNNQLPGDVASTRISSIESMTFVSFCRPSYDRIHPTTTPE
jgi:hypothetical protein